ncbi:hypothetical protein [Streptosporangium sp. LJ11]|uniref:hypothetical protein n=1 Tax=Streptosporangium sp. LJ11 TaxID=3436927 RepID=UPI003F78C116
MTTMLAQIGDLHLDDGERTTRRATRIMDYLRALPRLPDAVLVTGTSPTTAMSPRRSAAVPDSEPPIEHTRPVPT